MSKVTKDKTPAAPPPKEYRAVRGITAGKDVIERGELVPAYVVTRAPWLIEQGHAVEAEIFERDFQKEGNE